MSENYYKICPNCGKKQFYTNSVSFNYAVRKKSLCGECSSTHKKKEFVDIEIIEIVKLYQDGHSLYDIRKRTNCSIELKKLIGE